MKRSREGGELVRITLDKRVQILLELRAIVSPGVYGLVQHYDDDALYRLVLGLRRCLPA
jgi:hypothetical protein